MLCIYDIDVINIFSLWEVQVSMIILKTGYSNALIIQITVKND